MLTDTQRKNLQPGTKLIFIRNGGMLSYNEGYVFTFANWKKSERDDPWRYAQFQELLDTGNSVHNANIYDMEIFDEKIHKNFTVVTSQVLSSNYTDFVRNHGA